MWRDFEMDEERLTLTQLKALRVADLKAKLAELGLPQSGKVKTTFEFWILFQHSNNIEN